MITITTRKSNDPGMLSMMMMMPTSAEKVAVLDRISIVMEPTYNNDA